MMVTVCKEYKEYNEKDGTNEKITRLLLQSFANQYGGMFYDNASKSTKDDILADATYAVFKSKSKAIELVQGVHESYDIDRINKRLDDIEKKERLDKGGKAQQGGLGIEGGNVANSLDAQGSDLAPPAHTVGRRSDERAEGHPGANSSGRQQSPKRSGSSNSNSPSPNPSQGNRTVTPGGFTITNMAKLSNGDGDRR
ncbi:hypothetical protein N8772_00105 [Rickettsiales bacterium]|nr:hypothetical protein [Rickettsiales bacterium]